MNYNVEELRKELETNGFCVLKNAFDPEKLKEVRQVMKEYAIQYGEKNEGGHLVDLVLSKRPEVLKIFENNSILNVCKQIVNKDLYYLNNVCHYNTFARPHSDCCPYVTDPYSTKDGETCHIYKIGVYFQDHSHDMDALSVYPGTHLYELIPKLDSFWQKVYRRIFKPFEKKRLDLQPALGDAVLFDQRITHMGRAPFLHEKIFQFLYQKGFHSNRKRLTRINDVIFNKLTHTDRVFMNMALVADNAFTEEFVRNTFIVNSVNRTTDSNKHLGELMGVLEQNNIEPYDVEKCQNINMQKKGNY